MLNDSLVQHFPRIALSIGKTRATRCKRSRSVVFPAVPFFFSIFLISSLSTKQALASDQSATLSNLLVKHLHLSEVAARETNDRVVSVLIKELSSGGSVELSGVGRIYVQSREVKPRKKRGAEHQQPPTKEAGQPKIRKYLRFSSAPAIRLGLNQQNIKLPGIGQAQH